MGSIFGKAKRGFGKALKPRGPGVIRPKPTDRYGQQMKPKPIRPGKKDGGMLKPVKPGQKGLAKLPKAVRNKMGYMKDGGKAEKDEGQRRSKSRKLGRGIGAKSTGQRFKVGDLELTAYKDGGKAKKFPDLTGDGKVTRADILKGRGVFAAGGDANRKVKNKILKQMFKSQKEFFKIPGQVRKEMKKNKKGKQ